MWTRVTTAVAGVLASLAVVTAAAEQPRQRAVADRRDASALAGHVRAAATRYSLSEGLILAIIRVESGFNPRAVSSRGALGLMQIMPTTATVFGVRDALDPAQNVKAGAHYLRELLDRFGGDLPRVLAAYNAGEQAVARYGGVPPYPETRAFVSRVLGLIAHGPSVAPATLTSEPPSPTRAARYHPRAVLDALAAGTAKERVLEALATEWVEMAGKPVRVDGLHIRVSRRSPRRTLVEAGDLTVMEPAGAPALHWVLFEDEHLVATGVTDDWPAAIARYAIDLDYVPGGLPQL